jgi:phage/plasmid-associated DNA primase
MAYELQNDSSLNELFYKNTPSYRNLIELVTKSRYVVSGDKKPFAQIIVIKCDTGLRYETREEDEIDVLFDCIKECCLDRMRIGVIEKQLDQNCLFIDFDIAQYTCTRLLSTNDFEYISGVIAELYKEHVNLLDKMLSYTFYVSFSSRHAIERMSQAKRASKYPDVPTEREIYRDGLHIRVLGPMISRGLRFIILDKFKQSMIEYFNQLDCKQQFVAISEIVDLQPVASTIFIHGTVRTGDDPARPKEPYRLQNIYKIRVMSSNVMITLDDKFQNVIKNPSAFEDINLHHELSLIFTRKNGIIKKTLMYPKTAYELQCKTSDSKSLQQLFQHTPKDIIDKEKQLEENIRELIIADPDSREVKEIVENLGQWRATNFAYWKNVIWAIANISSHYKPLAEYFSRRSTQWNQTGFETMWEDACQRVAYNNSLGNNKQYFYGMRNLQGWLKQDNPEIYNRMENKSTASKLVKTISKPNVVGALRHAHVAAIVYDNFKDIYVIDNIITENGQCEVAYEYVIPKDEGESDLYHYKWRRCSKELHKVATFIPGKLTEIASEVYNTLYKQKPETIFTATIEEKITAEEKKAAAKILIKSKSDLLRTFATSINNFSDAGFISGVVRTLKYKLYRYKFTDQLDLLPNVLGVAGGVLVLNADGSNTFIKGYNDYKVMKTTTARYIEYNPEDPIQAELLKILRQIFLPKKSDTHEYLLCAFASTMDGMSSSLKYRLLFGEGGNAKSLLLKLIRLALGNDYCAAIPTSSITGRSAPGGNATPDLAMIIGRKVVFINENDTNQRINMSIIKLLTGDDLVPLRKLFRDMMNVVLNCSFFQTGNNDIELDDLTHGTFRRFEKFDFEKTFKQVGESYDPKNPYESLANPALMKKIEEQEYRDAMLAILLEYRRIYCVKYNRDINKVPHPNVIISTEKLRIAQDKIAQFIAERCVTGKPEKTRQPLEKVIDCYLEWYRMKFNSQEKEANILRGIERKLQNSVVSKMILKDRNGYLSCIGCRFLRAGDSLQKGEKLYIDDNKKNTLVSVSNDYSKELDRKINEISDPKTEYDDNDDDNSDDDNNSNDDNGNRDDNENKDDENKDDKINKGYEKVNFDEKYSDVASELGSGSMPVVIEKKETKEYYSVLEQALYDLQYVKEETVDQYYARMCEEYNNRKRTSTISFDEKDLKLTTLNDELVQEMKEDIYRIKERESVPDSEITRIKSKNTEKFLSLIPEKNRINIILNRDDLQKKGKKKAKKQFVKITKSDGGNESSSEDDSNSDSESDNENVNERTDTKNNDGDTDIDEEDVYLVD